MSHTSNEKQSSSWYSNSGLAPVADLHYYLMKFK